MLAPIALAADPPVIPWEPAGTLTGTGQADVAVALRDGTVLVLGLSAEGAQRLDPATGEARAVRRPPWDWLAVTDAVALPDGRVLVVGSHTVRATRAGEEERRVSWCVSYDPDRDWWSDLGCPDDLQPAVLGAATVLADGRVLVLDGEAGAARPRSGGRHLDVGAAARCRCGATPRPGWPATCWSWRGPTRAARRSGSTRPAAGGPRRRTRSRAGGPPRRSSPTGARG